MAQIRVLGNTARCMQRLGYLKYLVRRVVALETSSLDNLGHDLVGAVMSKVRVPLTEYPLPSSSEKSTVKKFESKSDSERFVGRMRASLIAVSVESVRTK